MRNHLFRGLFISIPYVWLLVLFLLPLVMIFKLSLSDSEISIPPYTPQLDIMSGWTGFKEFLSELDFENYIFLQSDTLYAVSFFSSVRVAVLGTFLTLITAYPIAYGISKVSSRYQPYLVIIVIIPFWTSFLIRVYSWMSILSKDGFLNQIFLTVGLIDEPLQILATSKAVYVGIVYTYLPFMLLPIYSSLERIDQSLLEAAEDLGCSRLSAFWLVTFRLSSPGIAAGCFLVFIPVFGEFVIPQLLGGAETPMMGKILWDEFFSNRDWPLASSIAIVLLAILLIPITFFHRHQQKIQGLSQ